MSKTKISLNVPDEVLKRIDNLANKADMERTRLIVNMIDEFSKILIATDKVGILQLSILLRNFGEKMSEWAKDIKAKKVDPL